MRFDDTLETVLAGDLGTAFGMQSAWRQLVDLIGRRRVYPDARALGVLRRIRSDVPVAVRAASARGLEHANPPAPLVRIFALDELPIAIPVLRSARLTSAEWIELLPDLAPGGRQVLRHRRDLSPIVRRALETYGPVDFVLPDESRPVVAEALPEPEPVIAAVEIETVETEIVLVEPEPAEPVAEIPESAEAAQPLEEIMDWTDVIGPDLVQLAPPPVIEAVAVSEPVAEAAEPEPIAAEPVAAEPETPPAEPVAEVPARLPEPSALEEDFSFVALAGFAASLPNVTILESFVPPAIQSGTVEPVAAAEPIAQAPEPAQESAMAPVDTAFADEPLAALAPRPEPEVAGSEAAPTGPFEISEVVARIDAFWRNREEGTGEPLPQRPVVPAAHFRFETDAKGVIRWVDGVSRAPIVGLSLDLQGLPDGSRVDGVAAGAFRRRAGFSNARMAIEGESEAAGDWLISAIPVFDPANGRFTGYRGTARRPRADERAEPAARPAPNAAADSLRQLVHELRTPTNAIAGFAEMIETQMLGPVADPYRDRASVIRGQARELLGAIDDLDLAARIDSAALALVPAAVKLRPVLAGIADDLAQLAGLRGSGIALPIDDLAVSGDRRAVERLLARLMATLVSASGPGERIGVRTAMEGDDMVAIAIDRPAALSDYPGDSVLGIDDEAGDTTLLGTGFALRLARNLARELGGSLVIEPESLTLRLPASVNHQVGQAHLN
ncbi:MAG: histidine kinase dimerization/phospho-acceptor domain-containing protein [Pseudomonadota bacterium]